MGRWCSGAGAWYLYSELEIRSSPETAFQMYSNLLDAELFMLIDAEEGRSPRD